MRAMQVTVQDISINLGEKPKKCVLDTVSFTAHDGEFLSLLGASGAGKSTLLKIIAGILVQDEGSILFDEETIDIVPAHKRGVGFVFQDMRLFPHMNVEENVAFPCKMAGMSKKLRLERARYLLECVHLEGFGKREVGSLSGGQQQRVALARALAGEPRVLLLDEPFSGLDENLRDEMRSLVLKLHRDFMITTIMVTHDAIEALEMSDRIVYLDAGKVIQVGSPYELFAAPASSGIAASFGECSVLHGVVKDRAFCRGFLRLPAGTCLDGDAVAIVRYRAISLCSEDFQDETNTENFLNTKCCIYRGSDYMLRLDVEGETLTVPIDVDPGKERVKVCVVEEGVFVFPSGCGDDIGPSEQVD